MSPARIPLLLTLLSASALLPAQQLPDSSSPVPTLHVTSRLVVLDVIVTDGRGHSIKGLKPADFNLTEDGVPQKLSSLTETDAATEAPQAPPDSLPPNTFAVQPPLPADRPRTVIVLGANTPAVRYDLRKFVKTVAAGVPVAIFKGDWKGVHLVQDFTTDPKVLQEAASSRRILPPLGFTPPSQTNLPDTRGLASYLATISGRINLVWISDGGPPIGEISNSFSDVSNLLHDINGTTNVLHLSRIAVYPINANGVPVPGADQAGFDQEPLFRNPITAPIITTPGEMSSLALAGTGFFSTQDPSLFLSAGVYSGCEHLADLAASTGGRAFCNTNGFAQAIAEVVETGSHYYTISYAPTNSDWNGALRRIRIDIPRDILQASESGLEKFQDAIESIGQQPLRIEYRNSYRARSTPDIAQDAPDSTPPRKIISYSPKGDPGTGRKLVPIQSAIALGGSAPDQIHFRITATPSAKPEKLSSGAPLPRGNFLAAAWRTQPFRNVLLHFSINPEDLRFTAADGLNRDALEFVAVLYRDDGVVVNSFTHTVPLSGDFDWYSRMLSAPLAFDRFIAIPVEGNYVLRIAVHEVPTDRIGAIEIPTETIKLPSPQTLAAQSPTAQ